jgi:hypothetical protein
MVTDESSYDRTQTHTREIDEDDSDDHERYAHLLAQGQHDGHEHCQQRQYQFVMESNLA